MTLDTLHLHESSRVVSLGGRDALVQRLMAMGFLPGTEVTVVNVAPFGDPITVELNDWRVSLRRADARAVAVVPVNGRAAP